MSYALCESLETRRLLASMAADPTIQNAGIVGLGLHITASLMPTGDGKMLALGKSTDASPVWELIRFNYDGGVDTTYANQGVAALGKTTNRTVLAATASDNRAIIAIQDGDVVRCFALRADGGLDKQFAPSGIYVIVPINNAIIRLIDLKVDSQNRVLLTTEAIHDQKSVLTIRRYDAAGAVDASFGVDGAVTIKGGQALKSRRWVGVEVGPDDSLIVGRTSSTSSLAIFYAFDSGGVLNASFGTAGQATLTLVPTDTGAVVPAFRIDSVGRIVVASYTHRANWEEGSVLAVQRLLANGSIDTTFANNGYASITTRRPRFFGGPERDWINDLEIEPGTDKIVFVTESAYQRLNTDGSLDTTFDDDGIADAVTGGQRVADDPATPFFERRKLHSTRSIVVLDDGRIAAIGYAQAANHKVIPLLTRIAARQPIVRGAKHVLFINGTANADNINVSVQNQSVVVDLNGVVTSYRLASVRSVEVDLRTTNDEVADTTLIDTVRIAGLPSSFIVAADKVDLITDDAQFIACHGRDTVVSGANDDQVYVIDPGPGSIQTGGGADYVYTRQAIGTTIDTGNGNDTVVLALQWQDRGLTTTVNTGSGDDHVTAGAVNGNLYDARVDLGDGNDTSTGRAYYTTVFGRDGNDTFSNDGQFNRYEAAAGDDIFHLTRNAIGNTLLGGEGNDVAYLEARTNKVYDIEDLTINIPA